MGRSRDETEYWSDGELDCWIVGLLDCCCMNPKTDYWEGRYQAHDMPWEKGEASPGLVDFLAEMDPSPQPSPLLKGRGRAIVRGTVCVPGCGTGHDVRA